MTCPDCGGPVSQLGRGRPRIYCSAACKRRAGNRRARRTIGSLADPREKVCAHCGQTFVAKRRQRMYCYDGWCPQAAYQARRAGGEGKRMGVRAVICGECGSDFEAEHPDARWCSKRCANRHWGRVRTRRRQPVAAESYTDLAVFERDAWVCHLCGDPIDRDLARTDPRGATIDHLIPLSRGGADTFENVAAAHSACNLARGNKPILEGVSA